MWESAGSKPGADRQQTPAYWRQATDLRTRNTQDGLFDIAEGNIPDEHRFGEDPAIKLVMTPVRVETPRNGHVEHPIAMLATSDLIVVQWKYNKFWRFVSWDFARYGVGMWRGAGPHYEVRTDHSDLGRIVFVFYSPREADTLGEYFADM